MQRTLVILVALALVFVPVTALATHAGNHPGSAGNVSNRAPNTTGNDLSANDDNAGTAGVQVNPTSGASKSLSVSVHITDPNGHADVSSVTVTVYQPDNTTVHISPGAASKSNGNQKTATFDYSFDMEHWHPPGSYRVKAVSEDRAGASDTRWSSFEYQELAALSLSTSTVSFTAPGGGSVTPDADTHDNPTTVAIENRGNVELDLSYTGTDLSDGGDNTIPVSNVHLDLDGDGNFSTNEKTFSSTSQTDNTFDLARSTDGTASAKDVHLAIHVPQVPAGTYTGSVTLQAIKSV